MSLPLVIRTLVMDWNGTVVDDEQRALWAVNVVLARARQPTIGLERFRSAFRLPLRATFAALGMSDARARQGADEWNQLMVTAPIAVSPAPGTRRLLDACKERGIPVGVLSAADLEVVARDIRRLALGPLLQFVLAPSTDKVIDLRAMRATHGPLAYVGDLTDDVRAAKAVGAAAVGFSGGYHEADALARAGADLVIADHAELIPFLDGRRPDHSPR